MRLILMGTGPFAVPVFDTLARSAHDVLAVVTRSVPPAVGRRKEPANPVRERFAAMDVPLLAPDDANTTELSSRLAELEPDLLVVCDFGQILASHVLAAVRLGGINLHGSLLPRYRGAAPVNWAVWNGESETGVTVIHMTPRLDAGPALTTARTAIDPEEDAAQLERRLSQLGIEPVLRDRHAFAMGWPIVARRDPGSGASHQSSPAHQERRPDPVVAAGPQDTLSSAL